MYKSQLIIQVPRVGNLRRLIRLNKFRLPTENQVIENIRKKALQISPIINGIETAPISELESIIMKMPEEILQPIMDSDKEYIQIIKNLSPAVMDLSDPAQPRYFQIKYGLFSTKILDKKYTNEAKLDDALELYDLESSNFGWKCTLRFTLNGFALPDRKDIDTLLKLKAYDSETFTFAVFNNVRSEELGKLLNLVYKELNKSSKMKQIKDISRSLLEDFSCVPLRKISEDYDAQQVERKLRRTEIEKRQVEFEKQLRKGISNRLEGYNPERSNGLWSEN